MRTLFGIFLLMAGILPQAHAAGIPLTHPGGDEIVFGKSASATDKVITFDTGDSGSNVTITVTDSRDVTIATSATVTLDTQTLTVGDGTAADQTIILDDGNAGNNARIFVENATGQLKFQEVGATAKRFGSGSGGGEGGVNILQDSNSGFEDGVTEWTASTPAHLTLTTVAGEVINGVQSGQWDAAAASDTLTSATIDTRNFKVVQSRSCAIKFNYVWDSGSAGDLLVKVQDGNGNDLIGNPNTSSGFHELTATSSGVVNEFFTVFPCVPDSGTLADREMSMLLEATADAAEITIDDFFLGTNPRAVQVGTTEIALYAKYETTSSCVWTRTSTSLGGFTTDSDCPAINVIKNSVGTVVDTTDDDLPTLVLTSLAPGDYELVVDFMASNGTASETGAYHLRENSLTSRAKGMFDVNEASGKGQMTLRYLFTQSAPGSRNFDLACAATAGTCQLDLRPSSEGLGEVTWKLIKYPVASNSITFDQADWHIDANIGGANPALSNTAQATYLNINNGSLDLVNNGGAPVFIACNGTEVASGSTCSADETVGIGFINPWRGRFEVCAQFGYLITVDASEQAAVVFQLVDRQNDDDTIPEADGNSRINTFFQGFHGSQGNGNAFDVCGEFDFETVELQTIDLMYENLPSGSVNSHTIMADRNASAGQRDVHFTVKPVTPFKGGIRFDNLMSSSASDGRKTVTGFITANTGTPVITSQDGNWIDSITDNGTGDYTLNFVSGTFSAPPHCNATYQNNADAVGTNIQSFLYDAARVATGINVSLRNVNTDAQADADFNISCTGED